MARPGPPPGPCLLSGALFRALAGNEQRDNGRRAKDEQHHERHGRRHLLHLAAARQTSSPAPAAGVARSTTTAPCSRRRRCSCGPPAGAPKPTAKIATARIVPTVSVRTVAWRQAGDCSSALGSSRIDHAQQHLDGKEQRQRHEGEGQGLLRDAWVATIAPRRPPTTTPTTTGAASAKSTSPRLR